MNKFVLVASITVATLIGIIVALQFTNLRFFCASRCLSPQYIAHQKTIQSTSTLVYADAGPNTLRKLSTDFSVDAQNVYYQDQKMPFADPASFRVLTENYAKDAHSVWYSGGYGRLEQLMGVDATTFTAVNPMVGDNGYGYAFGKDDNFVYIRGDVLEGADPITYQADLPNDQSYHYFSKDKQHVFYGEVLVVGADPSTFQVIDQGSQKDCGYGPYAKDKGGIYYGYHGVLSKIENVDISTFEILGLGFSHDKNHVYYATSTMPQYDTKTFKPTCSIG